MRLFKMTGVFLLLAPVALIGIAGDIRLISNPADGASFNRPSLPLLAPSGPRLGLYRCAAPSQCFAGVSAFAPSQKISTRRAP